MSTVELHHTFAGPQDAGVVVLSNSLGTTLAMWEPQAAALARGHRVLRYDLRGHGRSPVPEAPYSIADLGSDLLALLDRNGIARASLFGVSLGGMVSMWVAAHAPERVDRLILCSTSAVMGPPESWTERAALVRREGTAAVADAVVARWFTPAFAAAQPDVVARIRGQLAATPAEGYAGCCEAIREMDQRPDLPAIASPTLVIAAEGDPSTPPAHARTIAGLIPGARLEVLDRGAHLVNVEAPDVVNPLVLAHLA
ncbi:MAG TPA: 3-oxoadipate enol-lactonase [Gaiellales bacterium]|jgi:3-oxoadipate enol-lactonase|nr:3-oxoadipate enol-lactonase [Gaiellales bacterium]